MKKILTHPLFHFLLIGASLFLLYEWIKPARSAQDTIIIDDELVNRSIDLFRKEWGRPPSAAELEGLVARQIQQEVFYRQALKMNLDHNDELVRRRMEQKLSFITNDLATIQVPSDDTLKAYMVRHGEKYRLPEKFGFVHVFFDPDKRPAARDDAMRVLSMLPAQDALPESRLKQGDPFPFLQKVEDVDRKAVADQMGDEFADALLKVPVGKWSGPMVSGFGTHLVFVTSRKPAMDPSWDQVRPAVLRDYQYEYSISLNQKVYEDFRRQFKVRIELKDSALRQLGMDRKFGDHD